MTRSLLQLGWRALLALLAVGAMACAPKTAPEVDRPSARPVPHTDELSAWLGDGVDRSDFFIQMADTQLGMSATSLWMEQLGLTFRDDELEVDARLFETAIAHANELSPAFVVICGDLVNRVGHAGQIAEFRRIGAQLDPAIPLYVVAGNHDVGNAPTEASQRAYRETFGRDFYSFRSGDVYGIVLNSQLIKTPDALPAEAERQFAWLRDELARAVESKARHVLIFQHHPYFLAEADEGDQYFNIDRETRARYLALFERSGVEAVFAGHYHRNAHGRAGRLEMITTGPVGKPLGRDPSGFRLVRAGEGELQHEYFALRGH